MESDDKLKAKFDKVISLVETIRVSNDKLRLMHLFYTKLAAKWLPDSGLPKSLPDLFPDSLRDSLLENPAFSDQQVSRPRAYDQQAWQSWWETQGCALIQKNQSKLPHYFLDRCQTVKHIPSLACSAAGLLLLKEGLQQLGYVSDLSKLRKAQYGKPYFSHCKQGQRQPTFSISHSGLMAACIISLTPIDIGLDIEKHRNLDWLSMRKHLGLQDLTTKYAFSTQQIFDRWTQREAIVKATGRGLAQLNEIQQTHFIDVSTSAIQSAGIAKINTNTLTYQSLQIESGYSLSIARVSDQPVQLQSSHQLTTIL